MNYQFKAIAIVAVSFIAVTLGHAADQKGTVASGPESADVPSAKAKRAEIQVGIDEGDIRGTDHRALQAAIDYVAGLGGGTVRIAAGRYLMRNALVLRSNLRVIGIPGKTVLVACDGLSTPLGKDGDCNQREITLSDPSGFQVGHGVAIRDDRYGGGFEVTTATLTAQIDKNTFRISRPLYLDYMVSRNARASRAFPVVGGWNVRNVMIEGLTIEGNRAKSEPLDGCRGGGIYLFECEDVTIRNCVVHSYNGDGISFQVSQRVTVEGCTSENNAGLGLHPGSGSQHPIVRRNSSIRNGRDGLFVCWRVKHGVFEDNEIRDNLRVGISIGHKDTDNLFRRNAITGNAGAGVLFRNESEAMGAHRNVFEENVILDNGASTNGKSKSASIVIRGHHHDLVFRNNTIGNSQPTAADASAIALDGNSKGLILEENRFLNVNIQTSTGP